MATFYYDLAAAVNGTGTSLSPFNLTGWNATNTAGGNTYLFKRGNTLTATFSTSSGNVGSFINFGAWYYSDGPDEPTIQKPTFILPVPISTLAATKPYTTFDSMEF